jgi:hypothetical protein
MSDAKVGSSMDSSELAEGLRQARDRFVEFRGRL